jgi:superfamily II DNA or RNA helicase
MQLRDHQQMILDALQNAIKGQVYCPTGGGKTPCMIFDAKRRLDSAITPQTIVIVAPRILLAGQLCAEFTEFITNANILHVHSGETHYSKTTKADEIKQHILINQTFNKHTLLFTTYHSLNKVVDSGITIDTIYFDEAHNATGKHFFTSVAIASLHAEKAFYFTATPRQSRNPQSRGMNNHEIYGPVLVNVPAPHLINNGSIIPPKLEEFNMTVDYTKQNAHFINSDAILNILDNTENNQKVLVAVPSSKVLGNIIGHTDILEQLTERGYEVLHITSKFGAYVNKQKVNREIFFDTLTNYGKDSSKKFVLFHYSILSEGINCPGLTQCILLRNLNIIEMAQTVGRVIRMHRDDIAAIQAGTLTPGDLPNYTKSYGFVTVPTFGRKNAQTVKRLQAVVDAIFVKGVPPTSIIA